MRYANFVLTGFAGVLVGFVPFQSSNIARAEVPRHPTFGFPVYTNQPSGRQLSGQHAPATTPALSPEVAQTRFAVPEGFEVRLFASEPEVVNPVAMSWDERGRLWVLELYEYPMGAREGETPRDRIKILEDTNNDGRADSVKVFAEGLNLATGLVVGDGGAYVGQAPHLYFFKDTDGDDIADEKTIVLTGFGLEDRHELLNGFTWGPDGMLYMTHGVFTHSKAMDPDKPDADPVVLTAGVARFRPKDRFFEVFAEGTSNPWGVDFDSLGNAFVSACVIDHLFHLAPGGNYVRQAGQPPNPYVYGLLPSIVDHRHHMAAYAGVQIYQGDQYPMEYQGAILHGNIHDNAIHQDRLTPVGSSFKASFTQDFVRANDGWFMPVSTQVGPDGAVWIMDWYDRYPCYQNANADPMGVDREHGRIWRVVHVGDQPGKPVPSRPTNTMDLRGMSVSQLVELLSHSNAWHRRTAQRLLSERRAAEAAPLLEAKVRATSGLDGRLAAFWTLFSSGQMTETTLDLAAGDREPAMRHWAARFTGERRAVSESAGRRLLLLAEDSDATVQAAVATALRLYVSGQLTINAAPLAGVDPRAIGPVLAELIQSARGTTDATLTQLIWMTLEPLVVPEAEIILRWFATQGPSNQPLAGRLASRVMRRMADERRSDLLDMALLFFQAMPATPAGDAFAADALEGLIEGQRGKAITPNADADEVLRRLVNRPNETLADRARQLGALWGDVAAVKSSVALARSSGAPVEERVSAIQSIRQSRLPEVLPALHAIVAQTGPDPVRIAAVRALSDAGNDDSGRRLLEGWESYTPGVRRAVGELTTTRRPWRGALMSAVEAGSVRVGDLPPTVIRTLVSSQDRGEAERARGLFGRVNASSTEKLKLISEKRRVVVEGAIDLEAGREVARQQCLICHKLQGEGATVGPDLTGVGRSSLDALLNNVINPNEIIGQGYENVVVETVDDRVIAGRMVESTDARVRLLQAGDEEEVVARSSIRELTVTENSMMPEGLEQVPDADFRNLIWFILNPPEDGKPLTDERRLELIGGADDSAAILPLRDGESLALWAPEWQLDSPDFEGAPARYPEFAGRRDVLMTHPYDGKTPASLARSLQLPSDRRMELRFAVASHEKGDWEVRVLVDGEKIHSESVRTSGKGWKEVVVDLGAYAGRRIVLRLENVATDWNYEFGYWADLAIVEKK